MAKARAALFKHSSAHTWIAPKAEVVGGCARAVFEPVEVFVEEEGGKDKDVGWMRERRGSMMEGSKVGVGAAVLAVLG